MFRGEVGARPEIYSEAISYIMERPAFGYGGNPYEQTLGMYPHNIFLDILLHGGFSLLFLFIPLFFLFGFKALFALYQGRVSPIFIFLVFYSAYAFVQWNFSFDLATAYIPIGLMAAMITYPPRTRGRFGATAWSG
ncbi:O-antigen ligase family protein [Alkalilimnicola ehrlichii]|uniref:O-antigen ligase family protein n=1 Tax=Alkalilimnicola ehrlichii TaxID=351052 RepID=UPI003BA0BE42